MLKETSQKGKMVNLAPQVKSFNSLLRRKEGKGKAGKDGI